MRLRGLACDSFTPCDSFAPSDSFAMLVMEQRQVAPWTCDSRRLYLVMFSMVTFGVVVASFLLACAFFIII